MEWWFYVNLRPLYYEYVYNMDENYKTSHDIISHPNLSGVWHIPHISAANTNIDKRWFID